MKMYEENESYFVESWIQIKLFGKIHKFSKRRIEIPSLFEYDHISGYETKTILPENPLAETVISFRLLYVDWCRFEQSKYWRKFVKHLLELQTQ